VPGKHAPGSSGSFILSLGRSAAFALAVLGVVVLIAVVAVNSRGDEPGSRAQGPTSPAPTTSAEPTSTVKPRSPSPEASASLRPHAKVAVHVLNGNGRTGAAGAVASQLEEDGYVIIEPGNSPIINRTIIYYGEGYLDDANALRQRHFDHVKAARVQPREPGVGDESANIVVILGKDQPV